MLCERCQKEIASVHVTKIVNGQKNELHLCQDCARELGEFGSNIDLPNLFAGIFDQSSSWSSSPVVHQQKCPTCGSTLEDFLRINQFGCSDCYDTFQSEIEPLLRRLHGTTHHEGKVPVKGYARLSVDRKIKMLREQLKQAITIEKYEQAAKLRDQIRALEKQQDSEGEK